MNEKEITQKLDEIDVILSKMCDSQGLTGFYCSENLVEPNGKSVAEKRIKSKTDKLSEKDFNEIFGKIKEIEQLTNQCSVPTSINKRIDCLTNALMDINNYNVDYKAGLGENFKFSESTKSYLAYIDLKNSGITMDRSKMKDQSMLEYNTGHVVGSGKEYWKKDNSNVYYDMEVQNEELKNFYPEKSNYDVVNKKEKNENTKKRFRARIAEFFSKVFRRNQNKMIAEASQDINEVDKILPETSKEYNEVKDELDKYNFYGTINHEVKETKPQEHHLIVSDLHGDYNKFQALKKLIDENMIDGNKINPNFKVTILGDATDRGPAGVQMLMELMEMQKCGIVDYIPGNHDEFVYDYLRSPDKENSVGKQSMEINYGKKTLEDLNNLNQKSKDDLLEWLGNLPIQKIVQEKDANGNINNFGLAHAFFDFGLYEKHPDFSMKDAFDIKEICAGNEMNDPTFLKYQSVVWSREDKSSGVDYDTNNFPLNFLMVVGHTPQDGGVNFRNYSSQENSQYRPTVFLDVSRENVLSGFDLCTQETIQIDGEDLTK